MSSLKYRPEIDGLRAIAVLAVVIYHAHISYMGYRFLPGGFLGVDIFFVISGYLISKIILTDMKAGTFSFLNFYERRARRILPALFLVLAVCIPFAVIWMLPKAFGEFADSLMATLFFGSNIFFWMQDSYTAVASDYKPLLHTWSLAVEEQFYLFFPPLLLLLFGRSDRLNTLFFFLLFTGSLAAAQFLSYNLRDASFFLLPTRAWELVAGYIVARRELSGRDILPSRGLTWIGLALIIAPLFLMNNTQHHPGLLTFIPVLGTMMVLSFGRHDPLLSLKPAILIGLISYSLYLWHQPVFAFARIDRSGWLTEPEKIVLIAVSIVLGILSWYFVERPFRNREKVSTRTVWTFVAAGMVFFCALYGAQKAFDLQSKISPVSEIAARAADMTYIPDMYRDSACHYDGIFCTRGTGKNHWISLGDSHLNRVVPLLWQELKGEDVSLTFLEKGGCAYAAGMEVLQDGQPGICTPEDMKVRQDYLLAHEPSTIVVMARYSLYIEGAWFDNGEGGIETRNGVMKMRPAGKDLPEAERKTAVKEAITSSLNDLAKAGHRLIIVYPVPEMGWDVPAKVHEVTKGMNEAQQKEWLSEPHFSISRKVYEERTKGMRAPLDAVQGDNVIRVYPDQLFCDEDRCYAHNEEFVYYSDGDHLSQDGARLVTQHIIKAAK